MEEHSCVQECRNTESPVKDLCGINVCVLDDVGRADFCPHPKTRDLCGVTPAQGYMWQLHKGDVLFLSYH